MKFPIRVSRFYISNSERSELGAKIEAFKVEFTDSFKSIFDIEFEKYFEIEYTNDFFGVRLIGERKVFKRWKRGVDVVLNVKDKSIFEAQIEALNKEISKHENYKKYSDAIKPILLKFSELHTNLAFSIEYETLNIRITKSWDFKGEIKGRFLVNIENGYIFRKPTFSICFDSATSYEISNMAEKLKKFSEELEGVAAKLCEELKAFEESKK